MAQAHSGSSTTDPKGKQRQPPVVQPSSGNSIVVNPSQRLNPIVECIRNVPKEFGDIVPDYQVGRTTGVLFLSLRYHRLHPEYIHQRIERLGLSYNLRILLLMCDISEHQDPIRELTKICLLNNITVIVTWSADEAGQYLSAYKQSEHRPPTLIRERVDKTPDALLRTALTSIPRVNKTDVETLRATFGSFARIAQADATQIARLPGFGPKKVARLKDAFERPFRTSTTSALVPATTTTTTTSTAPSTSTAATALSTERELDTESRTPAAAAAATSQQQQHRPSPVWDIELDLNSPSPEPAPRDDPPTRTAAAAAAGSSKRSREASPPWDIELDSDDDFGGGSAALILGSGQEEGDVDAGSGAVANTNTNMDVDVGGGVNARVEDEDVDMESDTDLAPALRAKRRRA